MVPMGACMPDIRTILRSLTPSQALRNARRDIVEHERVLSEIDAIVQRLQVAPRAAPIVLGQVEPEVKDRRAS